MVGAFLGGLFVGAALGMIGYAVIAVGSLSEREDEAYMRGWRRAFEEMRRREGV